MLRNISKRYEFWELLSVYKRQCRLPEMSALAAMYASERGYSFIPVANDDLPTYLAKQQQKGCVVFEGVADEREIENTCRELRIPLRHCRLEGA